MSKLDEIFAYKKSLCDHYDRQAAAVSPTILTCTEVEFQHKKGIKLIAEIKKASPTRPHLNLHVDVRHQAQLYAKAGAAMISVLTESKYFEGSYKDIQAVGEQVSLPLLNKDFIYSKAQIKLARHYGATHILLITTMLSQDELFQLYAEAKSWGMEVLFEIHTMEDYEKIRGTSVRLVGINNRDLKTMSVNIDQTLRLMEHMDSAHHVVSESGIRHADHIRTLYRAGVDSFLIGEVLMTAHQPDRLIKSFLEVAYET